jgi:NitT/TauT family transport system substrate-binding protein
MRPALALAAVALAAGACRAEPPEERLVVATVRQPATSLFFVAQGAGCFAAERLAIEESTFELGRDAVTLLRAGGADAAIVFEAPLVRNAFADPRLRVLTALHSSTRNTRLVSRGDRGIGAFSDLRGRRIGVALGTNAEFFVDLALRFGGVAPEQVALLDLPPEASVRALAAGELDAVVLSDPMATRAEAALGAGAVVLPTELYAEFSLLVTRDDVLRGRAPAVDRLLRGLACAERLSATRREEALRHVAPRFPELGAAALRAQVGRVQWGLGLDNVLADMLQREAEWFRAAGAVDGPMPDVDRLVARGPLEAVLPEAVMILGKAP